MTPTVRAALDARMALCFHINAHWPGASESGRQAALCVRICELHCPHTYMKKQIAGFCASFGLPIITAFLGIVCLIFALRVADMATRYVALAPCHSEPFDGILFYWPWYSGIALLILACLGSIWQVLHRRDHAT